MGWSRRTDHAMSGRRRVPVCRGISRFHRARCRSKHELQSQLHGARPTDLIQRVETAVRAAGPEAVRKRLRRAAKQRAGQAAGGTAEVGVVQDVEEFASQAKRRFLGDAKGPLQSEISLRSVETAQHVAPEIALLARGRRGERRTIENLAAGIANRIYALRIWPRVPCEISVELIRVATFRRKIHGLTPLNS